MTRSRYDWITQEAWWPFDLYILHVANILKASNNMQQTFLKALNTMQQIPTVFGELDHYSSESFNSPALGHEFVQSLGTAGGRGETIPTVHQLHCLW